MRYSKRCGDVLSLRKQCLLRERVNETISSPKLIFHYWIINCWYRSWFILRKADLRSLQMMKSLNICTFSVDSTSAAVLMSLWIKLFTLHAFLHLSHLCRRLKCVSSSTSGQVFADGDKSWGVINLTHLLKLIMYLLFAAVLRNFQALNSCC